LEQIHSFSSQIYDANVADSHPHAHITFVDGEGKKTDTMIEPDATVKQWIGCKQKENEADKSD